MTKQPSKNFDEFVKIQDKVREEYELRHNKNPEAAYYFFVKFQYGIA